MSMWAALATLDSFVDLSDPDTSLPNSMHAFQAPALHPYLHLCSCLCPDLLYPTWTCPIPLHRTGGGARCVPCVSPQTAEGLRAARMPDWLQLTGLLHDLGKMVSR